MKTAVTARLLLFFLWVGITFNDERLTINEEG